MQKTQEKKFVSVFRIKLIRILISSDLVLQPWWVQTFFLRKYLILLHFLILKTPIEDSILCHKPDFIHQFLTRRAFACLVLYNFWNHSFILISFLHFNQGEILHSQKLHKISNCDNSFSLYSVHQITNLDLISVQICWS